MRSLDFPGGLSKVTEVLFKGIKAIRVYQPSDPITETPNFGDLCCTIGAVQVVRKCNTINFDVDKLRTSVETRVSTIETLAQKIESHSPINIPKMLQVYKAWVQTQCDPVSFGHIMSWLDVQLVLAGRHFIHENATIQVFAYICEHVRLILAPAFNALLDNTVIGPFLWLNGQPRTLDACDEGIEQWCDPLPNRVDRVTKHIYEARSTPLFTQKIWQDRDCVTNDMIQRLKGATLEEHLERELDLPNLVHLEISLTSAISFLAGKHTTASIAKSWHYLRFKVYGKPMLEEKLLKEFMARWAPEVPDDSARTPIENLSGK